MFKDIFLSGVPIICLVLVIVMFFIVTLFILIQLCFPPLVVANAKNASPSRLYCSLCDVFASSVFLLYRSIDSDFGNQ
jgi:hypothetical protein